MTDKLTPEYISSAYAQYIGDDKWTQDDLAYGIREEFEHGTRTPETNVTNDDLATTTKIAVAHLRERDDFYDGLRIVEKAPPGYWRGRKSYWSDHRAAALIVMIMIVIALFETISHFLAGTSIEPMFWSAITLSLGYVLIKIV
jgi:hypothetical protein